MPDLGPPSIVVFGGYGTFGRHVAAELAQRGHRVTIVGRDESRAKAEAEKLGAGHVGRAANVNDGASCRACVAGARVAVNCTGPFSPQHQALLEACLVAGCHHVDIADNRAYVRAVQELGPRFAERNLTAAYGCSSLPGISGAAALAAREAAPEKKVRAVRSTLFIGNDNPKGEAAIASATAQLGEPIAAPQGTLFGFCDGELVPLPAPFGSRRVYNFESPEYDLFPSLLGAAEVRVKVGFELGLANWNFATFATLAPGLGRWLLPKIAPLSGLLRWIGCSGGAVMSELFFADESTSRVAISSDRDGQRMAALPAVYAADYLMRGDLARRGSQPIYELMGTQQLLERLTQDGYQVERGS